MLLLLDLDGTIRAPKSGADFMSDPLDQELIPGALESMRDYFALGWKICGISNQAGVDAGHKSINDCIAEQRYTLELSGSYMCIIYFCPDFEGKTCWRIARGFDDKYDSADFRKPGAGMLRTALQDFAIDALDALYVGDRPEDELAAANAGIRFLWAHMWRRPTI